jgi:hypothetical protein
MIIEAGLGDFSPSSSTFMEREKERSIKPMYIVQRVKLRQSWRDTQVKTLSEANQD